MRIEDMTINRLKSILEKSDDRNIKTLRFRINQLYEKYFEKSNRAEIKIMHLDGTSLLKRLDLYEKHKLVKGEIGSRKLYIKESSLDRAIFRKALVAVDVQDLPEIPVIKDYVSIYGDFLKSPNEMGSFSITIRDEKDKVRVEVTESVRTILEEGIKKSAEIECSEELTEDYIPLYDLVLMPKSTTKKVAVDKKILKKKLKEIIEKEHSLESFEYLTHHVHVDDEGEEEIHHCLMLDHIANMFEQEHLAIVDGKSFIDGKEVKEGVFHVIKGLESTQEVAWSEIEAEENGIKPKKLGFGATLKQKAKAW